MGSIADFVNEFLGQAEQVSAETGLPADYVLGQAGLESGWGTSDAAQSYNYFGISPGGNLASYASPDAGFQAYANLVNNNYSGFTSTDQTPLSIANYFQEGGYSQTQGYGGSVANAVQSVDQVLQGEGVSGGAAPGGAARRSGARHRRRRERRDKLWPLPVLLAGGTRHMGRGTGLPRRSDRPGNHPVARRNLPVRRANTGDNELVTQSPDRDSPQSVTPRFVWTFRLDNLALLVSLLGAIGAGIWQGSSIRTTLQDGLQAEQQMRASDIANLKEQIQGVAQDVRELRGIVLSGIHTGDGNGTR